MEVDEYMPLDGFFDLREFDLKKREFIRFWRLQKFFHRTERNKAYLKRYEPLAFQKIKDASAIYQSELLKIPRKKPVTLLDFIGGAP